LKQIIPPNEFVVTVVAPVRAADTVYDARLIPLLLHEDFSAYPVGTVALGPAGTIGAASLGANRLLVVASRRCNYWA